MVNDCSYLVGSLDMFGSFIFPYAGNNNPNWPICFKGVETTNQKGFHVIHSGKTSNDIIMAK